MKCKKINHIGIAATNIEKALQFFTDRGLGLIATSSKEVLKQNAKVVFVPCGDVKLEFLEPIGSGGPIGRFIEKNNGRGGIHHIAIEVEDIDIALVELGNLGYELIDKEPEVGADGSRIAFIHPKSTGGVLIELCQYNKQIK